MMAPEKIRSRPPAWALLWLLVGAAVAAEASVELRYAPQDTLITIGATHHLSIRIDDPIDLRTIELRVEYDPSLLSSVGGEAGELFNEAGALIWEEFEEDPPGHWHGYAIVMDALTWITGPGELFRWTFTADQLGTSDVITVDVRLFDPDAQIIPDVTLPGTTVTVVEPTGVPAAPDGRGTLELAPNPFNPHTVVTFRPPGPGPVRIEVYDARGRSVGTAWEGWAAGDPQTVLWSGRDGRGASLPSGVYLFRLVDGRGTAGQARGLLLK